MTLSVPFSQSSFEQNVSVQRKINAIFCYFCYFEIKPDMRDVLAKMREISQNAVDTYDIARLRVNRSTAEPLRATS